MIAHFVGLKMIVFAVVYRSYFAVVYGLDFLGNMFKTQNFSYIKKTIKKII